MPVWVSLLRGINLGARNKVTMPQLGESRSPQQLCDVAAWCPFPADAASRPTAVHVVFLAATPDPRRAEAIVGVYWRTLQALVTLTAEA